MEDPIHSRTMAIMRVRYPDMNDFLGHPMPLKSFEYWTDVAELRAWIRFRTLSAELEYTEPELQSLRPMQGKELRDEDTDALFVKNGINPEIAFTQVHYIKGYFLLR